jgi:hypothetical protein
LFETIGAYTISASLTVFILGLPPRPQFSYLIEYLLISLLNMASEDLRKKKLVISGGTGFIGRYLLNYLFTEAECFNFRPVVIVTRSSPEKTKASLLSNPTISPFVHRALENPDNGLQIVQWDTHTLDTSENGWASHVDGCHAAIHLAGEAIFERRWNEEFKRELMDSRVRTTRLFAEAIGRATAKPHLFISASAIGIYGDTGDVETNEDSPLEEKGNILSLSSFPSFSSCQANAINRKRLPGRCLSQLGRRGTQGENTLWRSHSSLDSSNWFGSSIRWRCSKEHDPSLLASYWRSCGVRSSMVRLDSHA